MIPLEFLLKISLIAAKAASSPAAQKVAKQMPQPLDPEQVAEWMKFSVWSMMGLNALALLFFLSAYILPQLKTILKIFAELSEKVREGRAAKAKAKLDAQTKAAQAKALEQAAATAAPATGLENLPPPDMGEPETVKAEATNAEVSQTPTTPPSAELEAAAASIVDLDLINKALEGGLTTEASTPSVAEAVNGVLDQSAIDQMMTSVIDGSTDPAAVATAEPLPTTPVEAPTTDQPAAPVAAVPPPEVAPSSAVTSEYFDLSFIDNALQSIDLSGVIQAANATASVASSNLSADYLNANTTWPPVGLDTNSLVEYFSVDFINENIGAVDLTPIPSSSLVASIGAEPAALPSPEPAAPTLPEAPARDPFVEKTEIIVKAITEEANAAAAMAAGPATILNSQADPATLEAITSFEKTLDEALNTLGDKTEEVPIFDASLIDQALQDAVDLPEANMSSKGPA